MSNFDDKKKVDKTYQDLRSEQSFEIEIDLMGKPRMTRADSWKKRPAVLRYWALKDELRLKAGSYELPVTYHAVITLPMPKSWSQKKKKLMDGKPHQQKPDKDNLEKTLCDCLDIVGGLDDKAVWDSRVTKFWGYKGNLLIKQL